MFLPGVFLCPHFVKIPPWAERTSFRGWATVCCGAGKILPRVTEETKQHQPGQFSLPQNFTGNSNSFFSFFLFLFFIFYSLLFSSLGLWFGYGSVMVRFLRPARRRFRSFSFRKKDDIFQLGFRVGFLLFSRRFSIGFSTAQIRKILFGSSFSHIEKQVFKWDFQAGLYSVLYRKTMLG